MTAPEFPGVPGTATLGELRARPNADTLRVVRSGAWVHRHDLWRLP